MHIRAEQTRSRRVSFLERMRHHAASRTRAAELMDGGGPRWTGAVSAERTVSGGGNAGTLANRFALALLALATLYRVVLTLRGWPMVESDEAIIGLMARHILHGEHPIWFWGQQYMGALQAYVAAAFFSIFGSSTLVLRLAILLFTLGALAAIYALGRAAYGPVVGILTLAWLAAGPAMAVLREQTAIGGYQDMLLFGSIILIGVWLRLRQPRSLPQTRGEWIRAVLVYAGIGVAGGVGLWSDLLIVPVLFVAAFALLAARTRELFSACGLVLVLGFFLGGFPYIAYNVKHQNATYKELVHTSHTGGSSQLLPPPHVWLEQIGETLSVGVPVTLGSPYVCVNVGSIFPAYPPAQAEINHAPPGACDEANIAFSLAAVLVYLLVAWQIAWTFWRVLPGAIERASRRGRRLAMALPVVRGPVPDAAPRVAGDPPRAASAVALSPDATARLWLRLMMLGIAAMTVGLYTTNQGAQIYQLTSSRYLFLLYLTVPLLFGCLWEIAAPLLRLPVFAGLRRGSMGGPSRAMESAPFVSAAPSPGESPAPRDVTITKRGGRRGVWSILASLALVALLALSIVGGFRTLAFAFSSPLFGLPEPPLDQQLIAFLDSHQIPAYYSDYWTCYRIMFETNERITCAVRGQNGEVGLQIRNNRNNLYIQELARVQYPAYILPADTPEDRDFTQEMRAQQISSTGYERVTLGGYAIYYHP